MNRPALEEIERRDVTKADLEAALRDVLLAPRTKTRSENREPSKDEVGKRYRLDRRSRSNA